MGNLLVQFFTLGSSKMEVFETCFPDPLIISNDQGIGKTSFKHFHF